MEPKHALVVPFPVQGTFNALLDFSKLLSARGFLVTFVNTEHLHGRIFESRKDEEEVVEGLRGQGFRIRFKCIPDGLPADHDRFSNLAEVTCALQRWGPALENLAAGLEEEGTPITCVVGDFCIYSVTRHLALKLGVPRIIFWSICAAASVAQCHTRLLISNGHLPYKGDNALITCLPAGVPPVLRSSDLIMSHLAEELFQIFLHDSDLYGDADCVVVNSFAELEGADILRGLSVNCPALPVGPAFLHQKTEKETGVRPARTSMWTEDAECLGWLDGQALSSVLYVSFGSLVALSIDQVRELALGLESSQQPFLWSLRSVGKSLDDLLPRGFRKRTNDRGLVVAWAPQRHVLAHPSVGGFLTHYGWNSTLESISAGVPMVGWPVFFDQFVNCRFATEVWKVGMSSKPTRDRGIVKEQVEKLARGLEATTDGVVVKEEVERLVRDLMEGEEGRVVRENAKRAGEAARKSVMPGGSSVTNVDVLLHLLNTKPRHRQPLSPNKGG